MEIRKKLDAIVSSKSRLVKAPRLKGATWVGPKYLADVEYRDITAEGYLRHSSFKGLSRGSLKADLTRFDLRRDPGARFVAVRGSASCRWCSLSASASSSHYSL